MWTNYSNKILRVNLNTHFVNLQDLHTICCKHFIDFTVKLWSVTTSTILSTSCLSWATNITESIWCYKRGKEKTRQSWRSFIWRSPKPLIFEREDNFFCIIDKDTNILEQEAGVKKLVWGSMNILSCKTKTTIWGKMPFVFGFSFF